MLTIKTTRFPTFCGKLCKSQNEAEKMSETRQRIRAYRDRNPGASVRKIQKACHVSSPSVVYYHLKKMESDAALQAFIDACQRYENNGGDFAKAFRLVSVADIRNLAKLKL